MHQFIRRPGGMAAGLSLAWLTLAGAAAFAQPAPAPAPGTVAVDRTTGATLVPLGGSQPLQMRPKGGKSPLIKAVLNEKEQVARITPDATNPRAVVITGLTAGTTRVTLTDVDNNVETYEIVVQLDLDYLKSLLRRSVPTANIDIIPGVNNVLILTGNVAHAEDVDVILRVAGSVVGGGPQNLINAMTVGGVSQVQLDVVVATVNRTEARNQGFNFLIGDRLYPFSSTVGNLTPFQNLTSSSIAGVSGASVGGMAAGGGGAQGGILTAGATAANIVFGVVPANFIGVLQALRQNNLAKLLAEPKLVVLSGRQATFRSGGQQAVPQVGGIGGNTGVSFIPFGTELTFLPLVFGNGRIYLEVEPSITNLDQGNGTSIGGVLVPGRVEQSVRTAVMMEDGQTFAIGGLIQNITAAASIKTPVLGDLPFVGGLFNTVQHQEQEIEVLVLITPHLVDPMDCNQSPKKLPGRETRSPDDVELFLEGLLEAPRGQRKLFDGHQYVPAYKNDPFSSKFPCARNGGHDGWHHNGVGCATCGGEMPVATGAAVPGLMMSGAEAAPAVLPTTPTTAPVAAPAVSTEAGEMLPAHPVSLPGGRGR